MERLKGLMRKKMRKWLCRRTNITEKYFSEK